MKTKTTLQRTALTLGLSFTAATSIHAQLNGAFGLDMGGNSSTGRITAAETITDISTYGVGVFPQGWRTPFLDIANMIAPVSQFTGVNNDGTNVATLDLIPLRSTSYEIVNPATGVISSLVSSASNGLTQIGADVQLGGTLTKATSLTQAGFDFNFAGANVGFTPAGATSLFVLGGNTPSNPRLFSFASIELQAASNVNQLVVANNGNVGIGTSSPSEAKLVVKGAVAGITTSGTYASIGSTFGYTTATNPTPVALSPVGIYADGSIVGSSFYTAGICFAAQTVTPSDQRIKDIVGVSNSSSDLGLLEKIQVTDYTMKDKSALGGEVVKKVIAQQVEEVYPNAISKSVGFLPDIMQSSKAVSKGNGLFEISMDDTKKVQLGGVVRIINRRNQTEAAVIKEVSEKSFVVSLNEVKSSEEVFIYGNQVNDLRTVDYDAISMLNVSATQELAKKVSVLEAENAELKKLSAKVDQMAALIAALEGKSDAKVTVSLTK